MMHGESHAPHYDFYVDHRRGGETRRSFGFPRDGLLRVPDGYLEGPVFFGGRDPSGRLHYRATAFLVATPTALTKTGGVALVTARHNVLRGLEEYGNVWVRFNMRGGEAMDIEITVPWVYPGNAADVAAVPFWPPAGAENVWYPRDWFVTDEIVQTRGIGVGEELMVVGLFSHHRGKQRNLPIVRSGNIASMPLEPLVDDATGEEFDAYLAEVRSIGGLSGSPVFVALNPATRLNIFDPEFKDVGELTFYLLGLIRGHWNQYAESDFGGTEHKSLNTGIAMVTPITEVLPLLEREEFVRHRKEIDDRIRLERRGQQVEDLAAEEPQRSEFECFEDLTRKLVNTPKTEIDEKRKDEG